MIKRILLSVALLAIIAYLVVAITAFNAKPSDQACKDIDLVIKDSVNAGFITKAEVASMLKKQQVYPVGKKMKEVELDKLEEVLNKHPLIAEAECYKTPSGRVAVKVSQRIPILRVMNRNGENYYIDNKGGIIPPNTKCTAYLPVVTGTVEKSFAMRDLYEFALFLQKNKFWNAQIEQIHVLPENEIELVPRVGDHIVFLGKMNRYEEKLDRLKAFYQKGLNKVGWNKYRRINVEFDNQIICTKKEN